jgi:TPR repeat protein
MKAMLYAAIMEDVHAQHMMGHLLSTGEWQEKNLKEGKEWFLKAAQNGFPGSQNNIGWAYYKGTGVQKNIPLAVHWITRSADAGEPFAYGSLCEMYGAGNVFPPDKQEASCTGAQINRPSSTAIETASRIISAP